MATKNSYHLTPSLAEVKCPILRTHFCEFYTSAATPTMSSRAALCAVDRMWTMSTFREQKAFWRIVHAKVGSLVKGWPWSQCCVAEEDDAGTEGPDGPRQAEPREPWRTVWTLSWEQYGATEDFISKPNCHNQMYTEVRWSFDLQREDGEA